jgi:hypothetical protein
MIAQRKAPSQARRERNTKSHIKRNKIKNENEINKYKGTKKQPRIRRRQHGRSSQAAPDVEKKKKKTKKPWPKHQKACDSPKRVVRIIFFGLQTLGQKTKHHTPLFFSPT